MYGCIDLVLLGRVVVHDGERLERLLGVGHGQQRHRARRAALLRLLHREPALDEHVLGETNMKLKWKKNP